MPTVASLPRLLHQPPTPTMRKNSLDPAPEDITVTIGASFFLRFEHDGERGGYRVRCKGLPEVEAHGPTLTNARADARRKITEALEQRAQAGKPIPRLVHAPPLSWRRRWSHRIRTSHKTPYTARSDEYRAKTMHPTSS